MELEPDKIDDVVCGECAFGNLVKNVGLKRCIRCEKPYCTHFACTVAPLEYCVNCMGDLELTRKIESVSREKYNPITDTTTRYTRRYRSIHINGDDWLFAQRKIGSLSDVELELSLEFHKEYIQLLAAEQDRRRVEKAHTASQKSAKTQMVLPTGTVSQTVKTTKTTTTTKQNKKVDQLAILFEQLLDQGKSVAEIQAIIAASKLGK